MSLSLEFNRDIDTGPRSGERFIDMSLSEEFLPQFTLRHPIGCVGVGLHSGCDVTMRIYPAPVNHGIVFRRTDLGTAPVSITANWQNVVETPLCTTLINKDNVTISTIEHVMAALAGIGVDNVIIELDAPEVPIMDGSAAPFLFLIECAGVVEQKAAKRAILIHHEITLEEGGKKLSFSPSGRPCLSVSIDFDHPAISENHYRFMLQKDGFKRELCRARTFGFLQEVEALRANGLVRGGSLENAVVFDNDSVLNAEGLRSPDECVRHKTLDALGDIYLAGAPIIGSYQATRPSHAMNLRLLKMLFANRQAWSFTSYPARLWYDHSVNTTTISSYQDRLSIPA